MNRRIGKGRKVDWEERVALVFEAFWKDSEKFKGTICYGDVARDLSGRA